MLKRLKVSLALMLLALPATAQDFHKGLAAAKVGDYIIALKEWRPLAERGNAEAQYYLGFIYSRGLGVPQDDAEAVRWYRKAAQQGHASAQTNLGFMYLTGNGVPRDPVKVYFWLSLAAAKGQQGAASAVSTVARNLNSAQVSEAKRLIREWKAKHKND